MDAYWERLLHPWDLVGRRGHRQRAGGRATELDGTPFDGETGRVLATNGIIHQEMSDSPATGRAVLRHPWP